MWPELYEGATFEQKVFSNICLYSDRLYKTTWHCLKFHKSIFMNRSSVHLLGSLILLEMKVEELVVLKK